MKSIIKKLVENVKTNPFKIQLLVVLIYPILPLALFASWSIFFLLGKAIILNGAATTPQDLFIFLLAFIWFIGGPLGVIGGVLVIFDKHSLKSVLFFVYGSISYLLIAGVYIFQDGILFIGGTNYWSGLHSLYLLYTFWVIGKQLFTLFKNCKNKVLA